MGRNKQVLIQLPTEMANDLDEIAKATGRTRTSLIREATRDYAREAIARNPLKPKPFLAPAPPLAGAALPTRQPGERNAKIAREQIRCWLPAILFARVKARMGEIQIRTGRRMAMQRLVIDLLELWLAEGIK